MGNNKVGQGNRAKGQEPNLQMAVTVLHGVQEQVRFADTKAAFVAAFNTLLFGFVVSNIGKISGFCAVSPGQYTPSWVVLACLALYVGLAVASVCHVIYSVMSRFGEQAPKSKAFFGHIANHYGKDYAKYSREIASMSDAGWVDDIGSQIVEVSHVALCKHKLVRRAAKLTLAAFLFWLVSLVMLAALPLPKP